MSKSIKLNNETYIDSSSIAHNKHDFKIKFQEKLMNTSPRMTDKKWIKLCNIKFDSHKQGEFIYIKIFIGYGQNGITSQIAYIDLFGQLSWVGEKNGRLGCNAVLHSLNSPFTLNNTHLKIISNSHLDYDIWFKNEEMNYCCPNYIANVGNKVTVTPDFNLLSDEPTYGTSCELLYVKG